MIYSDLRSSAVSRQTRLQVQATGHDGERNSLKFDDHIAAITSKAAKRLGFLKTLKRVRVVRKDLRGCRSTNLGVRSVRLGTPNT